MLTSANLSKRLHIIHLDCEEGPAPGVGLKLPYTTLGRADDSGDVDHLGVLDVDCAGGAERDRALLELDWNGCSSSSEGRFPPEGAWRVTDGYAVPKRYPF